MNNRIISKQEMLNNVVNEYDRQYGSDEFGDDKLHKLKNLGDNPTKKDIDLIIGNDSWTELKCDNCDEDSDFVFVVNEYDDSCTQICFKCMDKFNKIIRGFKKSIKKGN